MARRYELLVFDWDGTVLDSAAAIVRSIQAAAIDLGYAPPSDAQARSVIGLGLQQALLRALPELSVQRYQEMANRYRYHYLSRDQELTLFEGMESLLARLCDAGHTLAVATGKSRVGLDRALGHSGVGRYFSGTRCADETASKPAPDMLHELMEELEAPAERTLMIGDTTHDLEMARHAGCHGLGVSYGAHEIEALESCAPVAILHSVEELAVWLRFNG